MRFGSRKNKSTRINKNMKICNRNTVLLTVFIGIVASIAACSRTGSFAAVNTTADGVALRGYDAVAYFAVDRAVEGNAAHSFAWNGAKYLFSSAENLEKFQQNPEAYTPQFGGYCSYAVSKGYTADGDPQAWKIVDGKLFLNYSPAVKEKWEKEQEENIRKGESNWREFKTKAPEHKG
jgi:YHS domain-containing protein